MKDSFIAALFIQLNQTMIKIRELREQDAAEFLALCKRLDEETSFMLLEPGERMTTTAEQGDLIRNILSKENQTILVAETDGRLVGYIAGLGGDYRRNRHKVDIVIGILLDYSGQGLGMRLFTTLEDWARAHNLHKLELTVMVHNERAISLYKKMGFVVEGRIVDSLFVNGRYVDELDMAKIINGAGSPSLFKD
jgi:RimJ/RimL family protein N-acetyltransferase